MLIVIIPGLMLYAMLNQDVPALHTYFAWINIHNVLIAAAVCGFIDFVRGITAKHASDYRGGYRRM